MVNVRSQSETRFKVLMTEDRPHADPHWTNQLSRLLEPQGVVSYLAQTAREAIDLTERQEFHAAVIDMGTPIGAAREIGTGGVLEGGGLWLLELLRRLPNHPPVVIVRRPTHTLRQAERALNEALRLGAFSVMEKPVDVEQLLGVFRRLMDKRYRGNWPGCQ